MATEEVVSPPAMATTGTAARADAIAAPPSYLAKVYKLGENDSAWQDCGVVRVRCGFVESLNEVALVMLLEDEPTRVVYETPLSQCDFRRDVATIISWVDTLEQFRSTNGDSPSTPGSVHEVALSFETSEGCAKIWEEIQTVQGRVMGEYRFDFRGDHDDGGAYSYDPSQFSHGSDDGGHGFASSILQNMPTLCRANLESIVKTLRSLSPPHKQRFGHELANASNSSPEQQQNGRINGEAASAASSSNRFTLKGIFDVYEEIEKDESTTTNPTRRKEELGLIYELVKVIALLDDRRILEFLVEDEYFFRLAGCFEYDPTLAVRPNHRRFLREDVRMVQVVPITNNKVLTMVTHRFRLQFLRDVLLARVTDEMSQRRLNAFEKQLGGDITQMLSQDKEFVSGLFALLEGPEGPQRPKGIELMLELCKPTVEMQMPARNGVYRTFLENDRILHVTEQLLADPSASARERIDILEILLFFLKHDPAMVREYVLKCENEADNSTTRRKTLLGLLVDSIVGASYTGVPAQATKLIMSLLDPESFIASEAHVEHDDPFITVFYEKYFARLLTVLEQPSRYELMTPEDPAHLVCELILYLVQNHGYLVREAIVRHGVVLKVLRLLERKEKHLVLDAIRFVRVCIGLKEKFFVDYIVQHNLMAPIVKVFVKNGSKNNLINSAIIELLEHVKDSKEAIMTRLVEYIVKSFATDLQPIRAYASTLEELEIRLEESKNGVRCPTTQSPPSSADSANEILRHSGVFMRSNSSARVSAGAIFGNDARPYRDFSHDDEEDYVLSDEEHSGSASAAEEEQSPPKRSRPSVGQMGDNKRVRGEDAAEMTSPLAGE